MPGRPAPERALENARKESKRWLKALRENNAAARERLTRALPNAPPAPTLRDVQLALARERGFDGWTALAAHLAAGGSARTERDVLVARFLDNACPDHHVRGKRDHQRAEATAMRLLARYPEIVRASFQTAVVCGDLESVRRLLGDRPALATTRDAVPNAERSGVGGSADLVRKDYGPKGWEPLLYLCFTRLPLPAARENAVAIARLLLDHGASPNAYFMAGSSRYTPLVGASGEGEEDRPPHPERDALVRLLLERGAEPYDAQVIYNTHFHGDVLWLVELMYARAMALGRAADWADPEWSMLSQGNYGCGARWFLDIAGSKGDARLAEWCLTHGASANAPPARDERFPQRSLYEEALRRGRPEIAELLVRHGATPTPVVLEGIEAFVDACMRLDVEAVRRELAAHPEYLRAHEPLHGAARRDRVDVARMLLDLGVSPEVENAGKERALHVAGYHDALGVAELLLARGAEIDPVEASWGNTPLAAAAWAQHQRMIDLFARDSRDVWELTYAGKLDRLRDVLAAEPERARVQWERQTPLMWLPPEDEATALEIARLFLAHGADPTVRNEDGMTAADRAERLAMYDVAEQLRAAAGAAG